jgi:hypothetical protein
MPESKGRGYSSGWSGMDGKLRDVLGIYFYF